MTRSLFKQAIVAGSLLGLATVAFFWQVFFVPNTWMPAGGGDLAPFLFPNYHFAAHYLRQGIIPLWNPHLYGGTPFAADAQSGLFYPLNLLVFFLVPELTVRTLMYMAIFHFWLAGFAMYLYLQHSPLARYLNIQPLSAFAGAIAFEFSDLFIVHFGNLNLIAVAAWLPLIMLTFQWAIVQRSINFSLVSGVLLATATLASHVQITLFICLALGLYVLWCISTNIISNSRTTPLAPQRGEFRLETWLPYSPFFREARVFLLKSALHILSPLFHLCLVLGITLGLSSLWLIPAIEMSQHTLRADLSYAESSAYSLNPAQLIGLLVPNYFGRDPALHWGPWDRVETGYIGVMTLLLAGLSLGLSSNQQVRFLGFLGMMSFLLALGGNSIVHGWFSLFPGFGQFRASARYILLLDFALAALATVGLQQLMYLTKETISSPKQPVLTPCSYYANWLRGMTWILGGLLIVSLPLAYYALLTTQDRDPEIFRRIEAAVRGVTMFAFLVTISLITLHLGCLGKLKNRSLGLAVTMIIMFDLFSLGSTIDVGQADPTLGYQHPEAIAYLKKNLGLSRTEVTHDVWHLWQPNTGLLHGLSDVWGLYNPFTLRAPTTYWQGVWPRSSGRYNFLGPKYIIARKAGAPADGDIVPVFDADPTINIYLNRSALPRVLFVPHARVVQSQEAAWEAIHDPRFDPTQIVIIEDKRGRGFTERGRPGEGESRIALLQYDLHTIQIQVTTAAGGYLVLSDTYYSGWQAWVNGEAARIYRANYAFRAVFVEAGEHLLRMEFRPQSWSIGLWVSGLTLCFILGWSIVMAISIFCRSGHKVRLSNCS